MKTAKSRNPNWTRDELILSLDLYLRLDFAHCAGQYGESSHQIQELSEILNALPPKWIRSEAGIIR